MARSLIHRCECSNCSTGKEHAHRVYHHQINLLLSRLNEPQRRWFAALEAMHMGHGGKQVVRLYGLRNWVEQSYKQTKDELGWADFMVRSDRAIRRHWILVYCAFSFCWWHETNRVRVVDRSLQPALLPVPPTGRKKNQRRDSLPLLDKDVALGARAWLVPAHWLTRCWRAFANQPSPCEFNSLLQMLMKGAGINLYL